MATYGDQDFLEMERNPLLARQYIWQCLRCWQTQIGLDVSATLARLGELSDDEILSLTRGKAKG